MSSEGRLGRLAEHPGWIVAVGASTLIAALVAVLDISVGGSEQSAPSSAPASTGSQLDPSASEPRLAEAPPPGAGLTAPALIQPGSCLRSRDVSAVTDCATAHVYEVYSLSDCGQEALIEYLGGRPGMESVRVSGLALSTEAGTACLVDDPTRSASYGTVRGVLRGQRGDGWRQCVDARNDTEVACSAEHTGEVVPLQRTAGGEPSCLASVSEYMLAPFASFDDRLRVETINRPQGPRCVVSALGRDVLDASVRGLGRNELPIVSS